MKKGILFIALVLIVSIGALLMSNWFGKLSTKPYSDVKGVSVSSPFDFSFEETEQLSIEAFGLRKQRRFLESIDVYNKAREIEPLNLKLLFDQSEAYARLGNLERAIGLIDTAISLDNSYAPFYNNRGLLKYKLARNKEAVEDFTMAVSLDSSCTTAYANMALAYYYLEDYSNSCLSLNKAISLGYRYKATPILRKMYRIKCKQELSPNN